MTGTATGDQTLQEVRGLNVQASSYEGPTSIASVISQEAASRGIETMGLIAHLPQYAQLEADHAGRLCILDLLSRLYNFTMDLDRVRERARQQYDEVTAAMNRSPEVKGLVQQLESQYEDRVKKSQGGQQQEQEEASPLSQEVQDFLNQMGDQFSQN